MKNSNYTKLFLLLFTVVTIVACVQDDEYNVPNDNATELNIPATSIVTIGALRSAWEQELANNGNATLTFDESYAGKYLEGYVISSDETGNFFEEVILQDKVAQPTAGVKLLIDSNPLFGRYDFGRRVYVELEGLSVGLDSGVLTLGYEEAGSIEPISETKMDDDILRDALVGEMVPLPISFEDFSVEKTNLYVQLTDVQFVRSQALGSEPLTYAGEEGDSFDGERILESCTTGTATVFSTSTFADFKSQNLATGRGTINAILTRDFFDDYFIVTVNSLDDIMLDDTNRCDPDTFSCDGPSGGGTIFWSQNFEQFNAIEDYVNAGWTNVNVNGGSTLWVIGNFNNSNYAQISGFNSGEATIETWLVTPEINMDNTTEEELFMDIQTNFDNGNILSVLFSTDFTGDVTTANWQVLDVEIPSGPSGGFGTFQTVGPVNISCLEGTVNIAFLYEGSDPSATTRYHIDNIEITGN
ncbi:MAG: DUF5689 domain-containing protein [Flavobacteriaceae bacterium]|nr:choice-of-anchor J domain-containing protein [Flavobacteriaceae bacterium]